MAQYDLGRAWKKSHDAKWNMEHKLAEERPPQLLFIERCLQLLKEGGKMGIILPESIFGMPKYEYIVKWIKTHAQIRGIVSMPEELFQPHTHAKTCILFLEKTAHPPSDYLVNMAIAKWCGHDSRGNPTIRKVPGKTDTLLDDIPTIAERFKTMQIWS